MNTILNIVKISILSNLYLTTGIHRLSAESRDKPFLQEKAADRGRITDFFPSILLFRQQHPHQYHARRGMHFLLPALQVHLLFWQENR